VSDNLEIVQVGQPIDRPQETEGARLTWTEDHCELMMSFASLKAAEVRGVEQGVFEFGLNVVEQIPFVSFRIFQVSSGKGFGKPAIGKVVLPWQECPFHLSRFDLDVMPHFDEFRAQTEARLSMAVILTDYPSLVVRALRYFTLSPFFTQKLIDALLETAPAHTREGYEAAVKRVFAQYPVNTIGDGARVRCKSGD